MNVRTFAQALETARYQAARTDSFRRLLKRLIPSNRARAQEEAVGQEESDNIAAARAELMDEAVIMDDLTLAGAQIVPWPAEIKVSVDLKYRRDDNPRTQEQINAIEPHLIGGLSGAIVETAARAIGDTQRYKLRKDTRSWNNGIHRVGEHLGIQAKGSTSRWWMVKSILCKEEDPKDSADTRPIAAYVCIGKAAPQDLQKPYSDPLPHHVVRVFPGGDDYPEGKTVLEREKCIHEWLDERQYREPLPHVRLTSYGEAGVATENQTKDSQTESGDGGELERTQSKASGMDLGLVYASGHIESLAAILNGDPIGLEKLCTIYKSSMNVFDSCMNAVSFTIGSHLATLCSLV